MSDVLGRRGVNQHTGGIATRNATQYEGLFDLASDFMQASFGIYRDSLVVGLRLEIVL